MANQNPFRKRFTEYPAVYLNFRIKAKLDNIESELQFDSPHRPNFGRSPLSSRREGSGVSR